MLSQNNSISIVRQELPPFNIVIMINDSKLKNQISIMLNSNILIGNP